MSNMAQRGNSKCAKPLGHLAPTLDQAGNYTFWPSSAAQLLNFPFHTQNTYLQRPVVWPPSFRFHFCPRIRPLLSHWPGSYVYSGCFFTKSVTPLRRYETERFSRSLRPAAASQHLETYKSARDPCPGRHGTGAWQQGRARLFLTI